MNNLIPITSARSTSENTSENLNLSNIENKLAKIKAILAELSKKDKSKPKTFLGGPTPLTNQLPDWGKNDKNNINIQK